MKRNITINKETIINDAIGTRTHGLCKQVICLDSGEVFASCTDAAEAIGTYPTNVSACCLGKIKTIKGKRFSYVSRTSNNVSELTAEIRILKAKLAEMENDAAVGRAIREEQEAARKAEEDRLNEIESIKTAIIKANERKERRQRIVEAKYAEYQKSESRLMETEREIEELNMKLLELEGKVVVA